MHALLPQMDSAIQSTGTSNVPEVQKSLLEQTAPEEEWAQIEGHDDFWISKHGVIARVKLINPYIDGHGYPAVKFWERNSKSSYRVHRLLARAFIPNPNRLPQVDHVDGNRKNFALENLEWVSLAENQSRSWRIGKRRESLARGEIHHHSKFQPCQVVCIRALAGTWRQRSIARAFGVTQHAISAIVRREVWSHLPAAPSESNNPFALMKRPPSRKGNLYK